jgi:hypothetical protein
MYRSFHAIADDGNDHSDDVGNSEGGSMSSDNNVRFYFG